MGELSHEARTLGPIILRLREIERKCAAMGARNEEFPVMQGRLAATIERLEHAAASDERPASFTAIARELFAVARLFESVGFMSVGREIAHIERTLQELDGGRERTAPAPSSPAPRTPSTAPLQPSEGRADDDEAPQRPAPHGPRSRAPLPVVIAFLMLVAAIAAAVSIVLGVGPVARLLGRSPSEAPAAAAAPEIAPLPSPAPTPPPAAGPGPTPTAASLSRAQLAEAVAQARLALARRDPDGAYEHLLAAARIERSDEDVVEIAGRLLGLAVDDAESAAADGDWEAASEHILRADRLAMRFGLDEGEVRGVERRIAVMERFRWLEPGDRAALANAIGHRVEVHLLGGGVIRGVIEGVRESALRLAMVRHVSGGGVGYTEEVPLSEMQRVKVFED